MYKTGEEARLFVADPFAPADDNVLGGTTTWVEAQNIADVTTSDSRTEIDTTTRKTRGQKTAQGGQRDIGVETTFFIDKETDAALAIIETAYTNNTTIGVAVLDDAHDATGVKGIAGEFSVIEFGKEEPLDDKISRKVKLKPAAKIKKVG